MSNFTAVTATIPTSTIDKLEEKIAKINAKGGTFEYRTLGFTTLNRHFDYEGVSKVAKVHATMVEVVGQQINVGGSSWKFVAHLDHFTTPAIVTTVHDDNGPTVAQYRDYAQHCDHCQQNRNRRYTFIVENMDTGSRVQVGSTCLQSYFGDVTAANLIQMATWLKAIPAWFDNDEFNGSRRRPYYDTLATLEGAAQSILDRGYHKTTGTDTPTKNEAPFLAASQAAIDLAEKAIAWIKALDTQNGFELDMQAVVGSEWVDYNKHGGILCYVVEAYRKYIAKQSADKVAEQARTEDCPNDGPKATKRHQIVGTVIAINEVDDYYGLRVTLLVMTQGGYKLFGTCPRSLYDAKQGNSIAFDCKIKFKDAGYGYIVRPTKAKII